MKFTGLILICASCVLALVLPAIGLVKFPMRSGALPLTATPAALSAPPSLPVNHQSPAGFSGTSPAVPSAHALVSQIDADTHAGRDAGQPSTQRIGMGVWLLLGPTVLIGLALWAMGPNPRSTSR